MIFSFTDEGMRSGIHKNRWRGVHLLEVQYADTFPMCPCCGQAIRDDPDLAFELFLGADKTWDGERATEDELLAHVLGPRVQGTWTPSRPFRNPQFYGIHPVREFFRRRAPSASGGCIVDGVTYSGGMVLADADCFYRRWGVAFGLDSVGDLGLMEWKERWPNHPSGSGDQLGNWRP